MRSGIHFQGYPPKLSAYGIKILNFVLATILLTSAALHQEKADVFEFDLVLGVQSEEVGPGDYIECSPVE